jgi:acetyltransferase-like isoleucine patch superfamily enzyme
MGIGISKTLNKLLISKNKLEFYFRRKIFGFENANTIFRRIDKNSAISILRANGAVIGNNADIETPLLFHNCTDYRKLRLGDNCHIGKNCFFDLREKITIEDNVVISMQTAILTHQDLTNSGLSKIYPSKSKEVLIKKNSYLGANSIILMGVTLNEGSFIAAGSVVNKNVFSYTVVGGVPAKFIKRIEI